MSYFCARTKIRKDHRQYAARLSLSARCALIAYAILPFDFASAQEELLRPGEAFVTRFSGVTTTTGPNGQPAIVIDQSGTSGAIMDLRAPAQPPQGQVWLEKPQRKPVTASEVGQIFSVALDDAGPPNIYVAATSAFGLHRTADNSQWMPGMWGPGGPGGLYLLDRNTGYRPRLLTQITLNGRPNSGAGLGAIAFDKWHRQFFVSDLETGMIHRIRSGDGADLGIYDHGTTGRSNFFDVEPKQPNSLPPIAFDPATGAQITDCATPFSASPQCWNLAASGRRIWGLGVARNSAKGEVRLYYAVWSSPAFNNTAWNAAPEDEKRNSVWSIRIGPDGAFETSDVRREFLMPDFFVKPEDVARAGHSHPVSGIAFPECSSQPVMLLAERGSMRNLGLTADNAFAYPDEARTLRYELDQAGTWRAIGRYDIGFYDRAREGQPFMRANCAGGVAFSPGFDAGWRVDPGKPDQFVWITGDQLCSSDGRCNLRGNPQIAPPQISAAMQPATAQQSAAQAPITPPEGAGQDPTEVHGLQGMPESAFTELAPPVAFLDNPASTSVALGPNQSYLVDTDVQIDSAGNQVQEELTRNDATKIGSLAIYQACATPAIGLLPVAPLLVAGGFFVTHPADLSHAQISSHGRRLSHYRLGSHALEYSHSRFESHNPRLSHFRVASVEHFKPFSPGHLRIPSLPHLRPLSPGHNNILSPLHIRPLSPGHTRLLSPGHWKPLSPGHNTVLSPSHLKPLSPGHNIRVSVTHEIAVSKLTPHNAVISSTHTATLSNSGTHDASVSKLTPHNAVISSTHTATLSNSGTHTVALSKLGTHNAVASSAHTAALSNAGPHNAIVSKAGTHDVAASKASSHTTAASKAHTAKLSRASSGSDKPAHLVAVSRGKVTHKVSVSQGVTHNATISNKKFTTKPIKEFQPRQQQFQRSGTRR